MKARSAAIQGGLAGLALVAAYVTWQRGPERSEDEVTVLSLTRSAVQKVRYQDGNRWVELVPGGGGEDPAKVWVTLGTLPAFADGGVAAKAPDGGAMAQAMFKPATPDRRLRGNEEAEHTLELFAPLTAARALGTLDAAKLQELGLSGSDRTLEVWGNGEHTRFVAAPSVLGLGSPYLRSQLDGMVYVLGSPLLTNLENGSARLVDRQLHGFRSDEVDAFTVLWEGKQRQFTRRPAGPGRFLVTPQGSDKPDGFSSNWFDRVMRLTALDLLGKGETPSQGAPAILFQVKLSHEGRPVGEVQLGKAGAEIFAKTEHTAGWVRLPGIAEDLARECQRVLQP